MIQNSLSPIRRRVASAVIALGLVVSGVLVAPLAAHAAASVSIPTAVAQILADTNALRAAGGLAPLVESTAVDSVAQNWSAQMSANGALTHNPNYSTQIPSGWTGAAENIAVGYTATTVVEAWHQSAGHYANIMGRYNAIGIGYYEANGQIYFTQDFGNYATVPSPASASSPSPTLTPSATPTPTATAPPTPAATRAPAVAASPAPSGPPILPTGAALGSFDSATAAFQGVRVTGWAIDPSTAASVAISVTVDGKSTAGIANTSLNWFPLLYPGYGTNHGFDVVVPATAGWHTVCVDGSRGLLGCKGVQAGGGAGSLDSAVVQPGGILVSGWSVDLTTRASGYIWIDVDGSGAPAAVDQTLPWINSLYAGIGTVHGFSTRVPESAGWHTVCVYGKTSLLGCKTVYVAVSAAGSFDSVSSVNGAIHVTGWSVDLRTSAPSYIWINVNGTGQAYIANQTVNWIEALFPGAGQQHGFNVNIPAGNGTYQVCVYGAPGLLGCQWVTNLQSAGALDSATPTSGGIQISGWAVDLTTPTPSYIWVDVDGTGGPGIANTRLDWIPALFPGEGFNHGFSQLIPAAPGTHRVCIYGSNLLLGCRSVTVPAVNIPIAPATSSKPVPSAGFPSAGSTGVPAGTALSVYAGPCTVTVAGTVIDAKTINCGTLEIRAEGVVISRSLLNGTVYADTDGSGSFTISDSTVTIGAQMGTGIGDANFTAVRVHVTGGNRSINCFLNCTVLSSYVHGQFTDHTGVAHESGIRMGSGSIIRGNTIACDAPDVAPDAGCSAALTGYGDFAVVQNNTVDGNLFIAGSGGYCTYGGSTTGKPYSAGVNNIRFTNNVWQRGASGKCGFYGSITSFDPNAPGNVWNNNTYDNGATLASAN